MLSENTYYIIIHVIMEQQAVVVGMNKCNLKP